MTPNFFGLDYNYADRVPAGRLRAGKTAGVLSLGNLGLILVIYNFLLVLPLAYLLIKFILSFMGYERIMRCPSGILCSRVLFVATNVWPLICWGLQLAREARDRESKGEARDRQLNMERIREEVRWWEVEADRLEGLLGVIRDLEVRDQLLREAPVLYGIRKMRCSSPTPDAEEESESED
ncbi:hypothetical protein QTJ16_000022 [Diplocarpon rosae]|uniref:Uncharacterized protein n=1 Tax=Diplocarpon rosae TaxID=946125 RepID=A0AAD9T569_9HELO|nr:hypothetical protein QTJ16_000022 [Diplocarpon rosae]